MTDRPMRVCVVTPTHWKVFMGGSQYQLRCLLDVLVRLSRFEIFYHARSVPTEELLDGYRIVPIRSGGKFRPLGYLHDARALLRTLRDVRPDVIYQRVGGVYTGVAAYYAKRYGARMVWHVAHDTDVSKAPLFVGKNLIRRWLNKKLLEYGLRRADCIVVQTQDQADRLLMDYGRRADRIVRNFHPSAHETIDKSGPVTVLWVANFKQWKRPEVFVRLAQALSDMRGVRFIMIGAAPKGSTEKGNDWLEGLRQSIEGVPNLSYLGSKTQEEVNGLLATAHIFVNTSRQEGFANTFIQAWLREVPVVSLEVDPDGVLEAEEVGIRAGSESRLHETVRALAMSSQRREDMGRAARAHAMRDHSLLNAEVIAELLEMVRSR